MESSIAFSDVFTISCGSPTPITVGQTTACITTVASAPTGTNPFLVPNTDDYPYRAGEMSYISWKPTTSGKVSLVLNKAGSSTTTTIAGKSRQRISQKIFPANEPFEMGYQILDILHGLRIPA
jgi:hypothetical protein